MAHGLRGCTGLREVSLWPDIKAALDGERLVRHAVLTFGGTWGVPGTGYCSWVTQAAIDNDAPVYEVPVQGPYSFGPIPGPGSSGASNPSYRESMTIAVEWAIDWLLSHPGQTFMLGGYSMGGECASRVFNEITSPTGRLAHRKDDIVGGFTLGNPCREEGHTFPGGFKTPGRGISDFNLSNTPDWWHDHANVGDLYTTRPDGQAGQDEQDIYQLAIDIQLHDFMGFIKTFVKHVLTMLQDLGGMPYLLTSLGTGSIFTSALAGLIPGAGFGGFSQVFGNNTQDLPPATNRIEAAVEASITGLKFLLAGTGPHITYESTQAVPGQTHLQHAVGHVIDRAWAVPARMPA